MKSHQTSRLRIQSLLRWAGWTLGGFIGLGAVLDAASNAINIVTPRLTYAGTVLLVVGMAVAVLVLRRRPIGWLLPDGTEVRITHPRRGVFLWVAGLLILLWLPRMLPEQPSGIDQLTGGDSFAYVVPQPHDGEGNVPLAIRSVGRNPLNGVKLIIRDVSHDIPPDQEARTLQVGVLPRDTITPLNGVAIKASKTPGRRVYHIEILAMNGIVDQVIQLRTSSVGGANCLADQLTVTKRKTITEIGPGPSKTLVNQDWHEYFPCGDRK